MTIEPGLVLADRFRIEKPIGSGGVGLVYRAFDLQQGIPVAVKCLRAEWAEHLRIRRRFMREARAISRLNHPNIVRVFDYGEDPGGAPYIAMEYLDGTPLSDLREHPMPVPVLLELADQVLAALAYIHARRIIHRDVKPENVIIQYGDGQPTAKLLDFGFARVEEDQDARLSQTRMETFGTPTYMAPEQATGKGMIGPPTDIYALGVMIYEFLAGQPPFTGTHGMAIALKHLMEPVPPLKARPGLSLPPGLEGIVGRMLKKAPADRFATAPDVRRALQPYRGIDAEDEDATLQTPLADAAAAIARIAGETAQVVKAEQSGLFRPLAPVGPIAVDDPIGRGGDAAPLVGREADLVEMWSRVRRVCETAEGKAILLGAEAGMGRRDVVEWVEEQVAEGGWMRVVRAEAGPAARLGRSGLATLLEDLFDGLPPTREEAQTHIGDLLLRWSGSTYEAATSEAIAGALASFLRPEAQSGEREAIIIRRACEAFRLASRDRPVLLTVLAADQADLQTQTFLWHLARSIADSRFRLLMILTWTEAAGAPVSEARRLLAAFERIGAATVETYRLAPLSASSTVALLRTMAEVDDEAAGALARCARGNPLLARELLLYEQQEGNLVEQGRRWSLSPYADPARWPVSLAEVFALRAQLTVGGLPDSSFLRACLDRAAVLGEAFDYGLLCDYLTRILGDPPRVERAVEALIKVHILAEERDLGNDRLRFAHPALRTALLSTGGASARDQVVHREAAGALEAWYGEDARPYAVPIAEHYLAARDLGRAGFHFGEAGRLAVVEGRTADARALFERAETLLGKVAGRGAAHQRAEIWLDGSELELAHGEDGRALPPAERAARWAEEAGDAGVAARAWLLVGDVARRRGDVGAAVRAYGVAADRFRKLGDAHGLGRCLLGQAFAESALRHFESAGDLFLGARQQLEAAGDTHGVARANRGCAEVALRVGDYLAAGRHLELARDAFAHVGDQRGVVACDWLLGETCRLLQMRDRSLSHYGDARRGYVSLGNPAGIARCDLHMARLFAEAGQWTEANARFTLAVRTHDELGDPAAARAAQVEWIRAALAQKAWRHALDPIRVRLAVAIEGRDRRSETIARAQLAWAAGELGDATTCRNELRAAVALDRATNLTDPDLAAAFAGLGGIFRRHGHEHRAEPLEERARRIRADAAGAGRP